MRKKSRESSEEEQKVNIHAIEQVQKKYREKILKNRGRHRQDIKCNI